MAAPTCVVHLCFPLCFFLLLLPFLLLSIPSFTRFCLCRQFVLFDSFYPFPARERRTPCLRTRATTTFKPTCVTRARCLFHVFSPLTSTDFSMGGYLAHLKTISLNFHLSVPVFPSLPVWLVRLQRSTARRRRHWRRRHVDLRREPRSHLPLSTFFRTPPRGMFFTRTRRFHEAQLARKSSIVRRPSPSTSASRSISSIWLMGKNLGNLEEKILPMLTRHAPRSDGDGR